MALLETNVGTGSQQLLKPDAATLFRQQRTTPVVPKPKQVAQPVAAQPVAAGPTMQATTPKPMAPIVESKGAPAIKPPSASKQTPVATQPGQQYRYKSPKADAGLLDKNYYEDLGFSTTKEKAEELRGTFKNIDTEATEQRGKIEGYKGEVEAARTALQKKVDNAWNNVATSTVTLGPTTWRVPRDTAIALRDSLSSVFYSSNLVPAGDLTLEEYKKKYAQDINMAAGLGAVRAYYSGKFRELPAEEMPAEGTRQYDQYMADKKKRDDAEAAAQKKFDEVAPTVYAQAKALNDQDSLNFTFDYRTSSKNRARYYAVVNQINPQIAKMKADYGRSFEKEAQKTFGILNQRTAEAQQAGLTLDEQLAEIEGQKTAVQEKQAADRAGMAETFNTLFRQRSK